MTIKTPVTALISLETRKALDTISQRKERSISQLVREAVNQYVQNAA